MTTSAQHPSGGWEQPDLPWTWSSGDFPASPSPRPATASASRTSAGAGPGSPTWCAWFDLDTYSWKTSQLSFETPTLSAASSPTWPRAGMTRIGTAYRLRPSAPRTCATGSSSWPTPTARDWKGEGFDGQLPNAVMMWPTPTPTPTPTPADGSGGPGHSGRAGGLNLRTAVTVYPTPKATDGDRGGRGDLLAVVRTGQTSRRRDWPTPTANRRSGLQSHGRNAILGQLNPTWVEWLMGFPPGWTDLEDSATP